jgi:XTP/dITP diphosphohydrolase
VKLVLATRNPHKVRELNRLLGSPVALGPLPATVALPPEDGETFHDNATLKARAAAEALGAPCLADDSGIEAQALGGAPGVRSARYAGPRATDAQNLAKLLHEVPAGSPLAYVCVLVYWDPVSGVTRAFEGRCTGRRARRAQGEDGFGYDPAFVPDEVGDGRTMAELTPAEKDAISHRGRAARELAAWLASAG